MANEWAAVAIRRDELDRLEREKEIDAERQKQRMYREELDEQRRLIEVRKRLAREKEAEGESEILERQNAAVTEERTQEQQDSLLSKEAQRQCLGYSLKNRQLQERALRDAVKRERQVFNEDVDRSLREEQARERTKAANRRKLTESLKQIYEQQADVGFRTTR